MKDNIEDQINILKAKHDMAKEQMNKLNDHLYSVDRLDDTKKIAMVAWAFADDFYEELEKRSENIKLKFLENLK